MSMQTIFVMSDEASALSELCAGAGAVAARRVPPGAVRIAYSIASPPTEPYRRTMPPLSPKR